MSGPVSRIQLQKIMRGCMFWIIWLGRFQACNLTSADYGTDQMQQLLHTIIIKYAFYMPLMSQFGMWRLGMWYPAAWCGMWHVAAWYVVGWYVTWCYGGIWRPCCSTQVIVCVAVLMLQLGLQC